MTHPFATGKSSDETDAGRVQHRQTGVRMDTVGRLTST